MTDVVRLTFPVEVVAMEVTAIDYEAVVTAAVERIDRAMAARGR